jgi:hypothetical protein
MFPEAKCKKRQKSVKRAHNKIPRIQLNKSIST